MITAAAPLADAPFKGLSRPTSGSEHGAIERTLAGLLLAGAIAGVALVPRLLSGSDPAGRLVLTPPAGETPQAVRVAPAPPSRPRTPVTPFAAPEPRVSVQPIALPRLPAAPAPAVGHGRSTALPARPSRRHERRTPAPRRTPSPVPTPAAVAPPREPVMPTPPRSVPAQPPPAAEPPRALAAGPPPVETPPPVEPPKRRGPPPCRPPEHGDRGRGHAYRRGHGHGPPPADAEQLIPQPPAVDPPVAAPVSTAVPPALPEQTIAGETTTPANRPAPSDTVHAGGPPGRPRDGAGDRPAEHGGAQGRGHGPPGR
jgi:translation initiation factor IF-2